MQLMCTNILKQFQDQLNNTIDGGDTFSSAALRNGTQLAAAWNTYLSEFLCKDKECNDGKGHDGPA